MSGVTIPKVDPAALRVETYEDKMDVVRSLAPAKPSLLASIPVAPPARTVEKDDKLKKILADDAYSEVFPETHQGFTFAELNEEEEDELARQARKTAQEDEEIWGGKEKEKGKQHWKSRKDKGPGAGKLKKENEAKLSKDLKAVEHLLSSKDGGRKLLGLEGQGAGSAPEHDHVVEARAFDPQSYEARLSLKRKAEPGDPDAPAPTPKRSKLKDVPPSPFHKPAQFEKTATFFK